MVTIGVLVLLAVLVIWSVAIYNRLVALRNRIANAFGQIDVQLKRRYDLVPNLVEVARAYLKHESATLEAVIQARGQAQSAAAAARTQPGNAASIGVMRSRGSSPCRSANRRSFCRAKISVDQGRRRDNASASSHTNST